MVVAVIAALYGLGVFKVGTGSVKCSPCFSYFAYVDYASGSSLIVKNGPDAIYGLTGTGLNFYNSAGVATTTFSPGDTINITGVAPTGSPAISITYTVNASNLAHTDTATIKN